MQRVNIHLFSHQAIKAERGGERNGDPRQTSAAQSQVQDRRRSDKNGEPLPAADLFAEEDQAQADREQGIDEVAETGLQELLALNGVDKNQPIERNEHGASRQELDIPEAAQHRPDQLPLAANRNDQRQKERGPKNAMAEDE